MEGNPKVTALLMLMVVVVAQRFCEGKESPTLGHHCTEHPPNLNQTSGSGSVVELGGLKAYVSGSPDSHRAIVLASDIYGYTALNLRKVADKVAAAGFYAVVPDFFRGEAFDPNADKKKIPDWLKIHTPEKGFEDAKPIIEELKQKGMTAIGAAGFCWGAKLVVELSKSDQYIEAAVILHPSLVTVDDFKEVKTPISMLGAEFDHPELIKQYEEVLSSRGVKSFKKIFPGVKHGWTIRYDVHDANAVKSAEEAHKDMLDWFAKYVS